MEQHIDIVEGNFAVIRGLLHPSTYQDMKQALPDPAEVQGSVRSHKDIYHTDGLFTVLLQNRSWNDFYYNCIKNKYWWDERMLAHFDWSGQHCHHSPHLMNFNGAYVEPRSGKLPDIAEPFLFSRMDVGYGFEGYGQENGGKGVHIDLRQRVMSGLLYFSNQDELEGGEFEVWNADGSQLLQRIPVEENMAIVSVQNEHAWHAVNPVTKLKTGSPRTAAYFALSCTQKFWKRR